MSGKNLMFSVEELNLLMANCPYLVTQVDSEGEILATSRDFEYGRSKTIVGRKVFDFVDKAHHSDIREALHRAFVDHEVVEYHAVGNIDLGEREYVSKFIPYVNDQGQIEKVLQMTEDVTEKRWTERQLVESSKLAAVGELASAVGHEINNPLAIIKGYLEIISKEIESKSILNDTIRGGIDAQLISIDRIAKISSSLRKFVKRKQNSTSFELNDVIRNTVVLYELLFSHHSIYFDMKLDASECIIAGDPDCLYQVLSNLFNNARDAFSEKKNGIISLSTIVHEDRVEIHVNDDGKGIAKDNIGKIFDTYYTSKEWGTGLGLSISYRLIKGMGGAIAVESQEGVGSRFKITLPLSEGSTRPDEPKTTPRLKQPRLEGKALVIEDEIMLAAVIEDSLQDFGIDVTVCNEGECGLVALKKNKYRFVMTDLTLPGLKGIPLLKELIANLNGAHLIVVTGGNLPDSKEYQDLVNENFVSATVNKPFSRSQIISVLNGLA